MIYGGMGGERGLRNSSGKHGLIEFASVIDLTVSVCASQTSPTSRFLVLYRYFKGLCMSGHKLTSWESLMAKGLYHPSN